MVFEFGIIEFSEFLFLGNPGISIFNNDLDHWSTQDSISSNDSYHLIGLELNVKNGVHSIETEFSIDVWETSTNMKLDRCPGGVVK